MMALIRFLSYIGIGLLIHYQDVELPRSTTFGIFALIMVIDFTSAICARIDEKRKLIR